MDVARKEYTSTKDTEVRKSNRRLANHPLKASISMDVGRCLDAARNNVSDETAFSKLRSVNGKALSKSMESSNARTSYYYARNSRVKPAKSDIQVDLGVSKDLVDKRSDEASTRKNFSRDLEKLKVKKSSSELKDAAIAAKDAEKIQTRSAVVEKRIAESVAEAVNAKVKSADMPCDMQIDAFRFARSALDKQNRTSFSCREVAYILKKEFDKRYGPAWHCIVGTRFGSFVTHSSGRFLYFSVDKVSILLFKTAVTSFL